MEQKNYKIAHVKKRAIAFLLDNIIVSFFSSLITLIGGLIFVYLTSPEINTPQAAFKAIPSYTFEITTFLIFILYSVYFHNRDNKSPGKSVMNLTVISTEGGNNDIPFLKWLMRSLMTFIESLLWFITIILIIVSKDNKKISDHLFSTLVIEETPKTDPNSLKTVANT